MPTQAEPHKPHSASRRWLTIGVLAVGLAACAWGAIGLARWWHEGQIQRRLDNLGPIIRKHSQANALPADLVREIIRLESGGETRAVSKMGAKGLMQITPITEREMQQRSRVPPGDLFEADYNVMLGTAYLRRLINRFDGDLWLALAAYNAGPTRVQRLRDAHPQLSGQQLVSLHTPGQTQAYCRRLLKNRPDHRLPPVRSSAQTQP